MNPSRFAILLGVFWLAACTTARPTSKPFTVADAFAASGKALATVELSPTPTMLATAPPNIPPTAAPTLMLPTSVALGVPTSAIGGPTIPGATLTSTPAPAACASQPPLPFAAVWVNIAQARSLMHCPVSGPDVVNGVWQFFERGAMFWRSSDKSIFVISNAGITATKPTDSWWRMADTWSEGEGDDLLPGAEVPPGFIKPLRGFGKVWVANGFVRQALGWATSDEIPMDGQWMTFEGGWMMTGPNGGPIYVMVPLDAAPYTNGYHLGPQ